MNEIWPALNLELLAQNVVGPKILSDLNKLSKNVKVICLCEMLNDLGSSIHQPLIPVLYRMLGANPLQYGMIEGLSSFFGMIWAAPAGGLSDRLGRKKIYAAGHALMGLMRPTWGWVSSFWLLLPLRWLYMLGMGVRYSARDTLLAESATQENRGLTYAAYEISDCIGSLTGPFLPIMILGYAGQNIDVIRILFFLAAVPNLASLLLVSFHVKETVNPEQSAKKAIGLSDMFKMISDDKNLLRFILPTSIFTVFATTVEVQMLYLTFGPLKTDAFVTTIMYLFWTAATVLAALPAGRVVDKMGRRFGVVLSFLFYAMSTIVIIVHHYVFPSIFFIPVAFTLLGFFDSFFSVSGKTFVADSSSARNRGASIGLYTTLNGVCRRSFAPIVAGILFTVYSPITPFIVGLTASMTAMVLLTRTTSEVHEDKLA